jgi:hypothetical protein
VRLVRKQHRKRGPGPEKEKEVMRTFAILLALLVGAETANANDQQVPCWEIVMPAPVNEYSLLPLGALKINKMHRRNLAVAVLSPR